jgi:hypothetical protein
MSNLHWGCVDSTGLTMYCRNESHEIKDPVTQPAPDDYEYKKTIEAFPPSVAKGVFYGSA